MRRRSRVNFVRVGEHFALGRSAEAFGIWDRRAVEERRPGPPIHSYPLTDEGWAAAWAQYLAWEPATPAETPAAEEPTRIVPTQDPGPSSAAPSVGPHRARWWRWAIPVAVVAVLAAAGGLVAVTRSPSKAARLSANGSSSGSDTTVTEGSAGSSSAATSTTVAAAVGSGYLASGSGWIDFIQWTDHDGILSGTAQAITTNGAPPSLRTQSETLEVSGTEQGSTLAVRFNGGPETFGTLADGSFTLNFPQSDGSLAPITFSQAVATAFNAALSQLQQQVAVANQNEANAEALQKAQSQIDADAQAVANDIANGLPQADAGLSSDIASMAKDVQGTGSDTAGTHTDEQKVITEAQQHPDGNDGGVCSDASAVSSDASGVASDASGVASDGSGVEGDLQATRSALNRLGADWSQLQSDEANLPGYQPANPPTQKQVSGATAEANAAISHAVASANADIDQANADVTAAYGYAAGAYQAGNCGTPPSAPQPQGHIS